MCLLNLSFDNMIAKLCSRSLLLPEQYLFFSVFICTLFVINVRNSRVYFAIVWRLFSLFYLFFTMDNKSFKISFLILKKYTDGISEFSSSCQAC